ncbi:MAG: glycoside hydrolase family 25 protein [Alloprevotella sp.]|nr:glycoside hydrolase family 25 protein [Alloprevotella sp.]MBR1651946.1 glycoside hydrolase family 25 protein [Alloprevotella sp.]
MKRRRKGKAAGRKLKGTLWKRALWIGAILAAVLYAAAFYFYGVSPYGLRWKARYGEVGTPAGYDIHGIDISHHQGKIDWDALEKARIGGEPITFVFVKATEGTSIRDANFVHNFDQAGEHGFMRGAYHFFSPETPARLQAEYFIHNTPLHYGDLPPVLDIEKEGTLSVQEVREAALEWLRIVEARYKCKPIIYTYYKFKMKYLNTDEFNEYPYWIAHYYVDKLDYKGEWKFWQHTDCGRLPGIQGNVDCNVYSGSMYDLRHHTVKSD